MARADHPRGNSRDETLWLASHREQRANVSDRRETLAVDCQKNVIQSLGYEREHQKKIGF
jgi:hypothetical protein